MDALSILGTVLGLGLSSGLNLYATVLSTGLAIRLGWLVLPGPLESLAVLAHPAVLIAAGLMYLIEFFADKIPFVDHVWDFLHTAIRPIGATLIAWRAVGGQVSDVWLTVILLVAGGTALATHAGKAGARLTSAATGAHAAGGGIFLSVIEDIVALTLAPLAVAHPYWSLFISIFLLCLLAIAIRIGFRSIRSMGRDLYYAVQHKLLHPGRETLERGTLPHRAVVAFDAAGVRADTSALVLPACAYRLKGIPRYGLGFAAIDPNHLTFVYLGWFRTRVVSVPWSDGAPAVVKKLFSYQLRIDTPARRVVLAFHPLTKPMAARLGGLPSPALRPVSAHA